MLAKKHELRLALPADFQNRFCVFLAILAEGQKSLWDGVGPVVRPSVNFFS